MKTLKHEEVNRTEYRNLADARTRIGRFLESIYNDRRMHSSLEYRSPNEFESSLTTGLAKKGSGMSFFRHGRSTGPMYGKTNRGTEAPLLIVRDESHRLSLGELLSSRARFRFAGCAHHAMNTFRRSSSFQPTAICGLTVCLNLWVHPTHSLPFLRSKIFVPLQ